MLSKITHIAIDEDDDLEYVDDGVHLCVDNCAAQRYADEDTYMRIVYPDDESITQMHKSPVFIIFGGNTLSRGLTIEGLVCSYFARNVTQADTLMQMARWFGYRRGYELLQRIWMPKQSQEYFKLLAQIDETLKTEFDDFVEKNRSPIDFGPKVMNSKSVSKLKITAQNRMQAAVEIGSGFNGRAFETTKFKESDLENNLCVLNKFLNKFDKIPVKSSHSNSSILWRGIDSSLVLDFIKNYKNHPDETYKLDKILNFIEAANKMGNYQEWSVGIVGGDSATANKLWKPHEEVEIIKSVRSKLLNEPDIDINSLRSSQDALIDIDYNTLNNQQRAIYEHSHRYTSEITANRGKLNLKDTPLLLIYRIDKDAPKNVTRKDGRERTDINTKFDIIAFSIIISGDGNENHGPNYLGIL